MKEMQMFARRGVETLSYEGILEKWTARKVVDCGVFSGNFLLNFVSCTNQIEDINVDFNTTRELFESGTLNSYTGDLRDVMSVLNNKNVASYLNAAISRSAPVDLELIKETHRLLLFASIDEHRYHDNGERAGTFKQKDYCVGRLSVGSPPENVEVDLQDLCDILQGNSGKDPAKVATMFQCYFEHIHPFADGNGRVGRWLTNYVLVSGGHPPILFTTESRQEYFKALENFDACEDYSLMLNYIKKQTVLSWPSLREKL